MKKEDCFYLGKIVKPFSYKGELVLWFDVDDVEDYVGLKYVYLDITGKLVRYDISTLRLHGGKIVVGFKDLSLEESTALIGKEMYLPLTMLKKLDGNQFYFHEVVGFDVVDKKYGNIGKITEIVSSTPQPVMVTMFEDKEILIPLVDEIINEVNREKKTIYISAPDGLIDIYINP